MTTIRAVVRDGRLETATAIDLPDGTELMIAIPDPSEPLAGQEDLCADTPEAIAAWLRWYDALEPLEFTPKERAAWDAAREQDKAVELAQWHGRSKRLEELFP